MVQVNSLNKIPLIGGLVSGGGGAPAGDLEHLYSTTFDNPGAETGDLTDWTTTGGVTVETSATNVSGPHAGTYFFAGSDDQASSQMSQRLAVPAARLTLVDAGNAKLILKWFQGQSGDDAAQPFAQFYDFEGNAIGSEINPNIQTPTDAFDWAKRGWSFDIPTLARSVELGIKFTRVAGTVLNAYVDDLSNEWVDPAVNPEVAISVLPPQKDNSPAASTSTTISNYTFDTVGDYLVMICGSCATEGSTSIPTITSFGDANVTYTIIEELDNTGTFDFIIALKVSVAVAGDYDITMTCGDGQWYRWLIGSWLTHNADFDNAVTFDFVNNSDVSEVVTPAAGSSLSIFNFTRLSADPSDTTGLSADAHDYAQSMGSTFFSMDCFTEVDLAASELTLGNAQGTSRQLTLGVFLPPLTS